MKDPLEKMKIEQYFFIFVVWKAHQYLDLIHD